MPKHPEFVPSLATLKAGVISAAVLATLGLAAPRPAQALTVVLNFVPSLTTDIFGVGALPESFSAWGFTGMSLADIRTATLAAVQQDFLSYPTVGSNASSPLPNGKELDINFTFSTGLTGPGNGDSEYYYMSIGDADPDQSFLGQACVGVIV